MTTEEEMTLKRRVQLVNLYWFKYSRHGRSALWYGKWEEAKQKLSDYKNELEQKYGKAPGTSN